MEWVIERGDRSAVRTVRCAIARQLRELGGSPVEVESAELVVSELITNAVVHTAGRVWVTLDWTTARPVVMVRDLGAAFELSSSLPTDPRAPGGRGLFIAGAAAGHLELRRSDAGGSEVRATLAVTGPPERDQGSVVEGGDR